MMKRAYVDTPDGQVHYKTEGSGESILLLHQTPCSEETTNLIPFLANNYRVIAMDTVGYGNSFLPSREYEIEDFAQSVINFIDALEIKKINLFGHHTGAIIAIEVTYANPERVDKLILSGYCEWEREQWEQLAKNIGSRPAMDADGQFLLRSWETFTRFSPDSKPEVLIGPVISSLMARTKPYDAHVACARYHLDNDIPARLRSIKSPVLIINGTSDPYMYPGKPEVTKNMIPRCKIQDIEGGTLICYEKPREVAQAVLDFLKNPGV